MQTGSRLYAPPHLLACTTLGASQPGAQVLLCTAPVQPACDLANVSFTRDLTIEGCQEDLGDDLAEAEADRDCRRDAADAVMAPTEDVKKQSRCKSGEAEDC